MRSRLIGSHFTPVQVVRSKTLPRRYLTMPLPQDATRPNSFVIFANDTIADFCIKTLDKSSEYEIECTELYIPRFIAEEMRMQLVVIMNTYCEIESRHQIWNAAYYTPQVPAAQVFRQKLQTNWGE